MAPFKSSLAKSLGKFLGVSKQQDLDLRGATQSNRFREPPVTWDGATLATTATYTAPFPSPTRSYKLCEFICVGAGGGPHPSGTGAGQGGFTIGRFIIPATTPLLFAVGQTGSNGQPGPGVGGAGWDPSTGSGGSGQSAYPPGSTLGGSGGGGLTGVFVSSASQENAIVIAGGGGGVRYNGGYGGNGGGPTADSAPSPGTGGGGGGGSQVAGGAGGGNQPGLTPSLTATAGTALNGGDGGSVNPDYAPTMAYGGGGGGGGYYGGGGGGSSTTTSGTNSAGGGGGSGYLNTSSPWYHPEPTVERNYTGMGYPIDYGTGPNPAPLGAGKDYPQISPLGVEYGNSNQNGYLIVNYYNPG